MVVEGIDVEKRSLKCDGRSDFLQAPSSLSRACGRDMTTITTLQTASCSRLETGDRDARGSNGSIEKRGERIVRPLEKFWKELK